jgi:hypothetical protein
VTEAEVKLGNDPSLIKAVAQSGNVTTVAKDGAQSG